MKTYGFQPVEVTPDQYLFGARGGILGGDILRPDGQWYGWLPEVEIQKKYGLETMNCTVYGTLNALEILHKFHFGEEVNYSERFVGILAETSPSGNNPHKVAETIRKVSGCIDDILLPFSESVNTWEKYYGPIPVPNTLLQRGQAWLREYKFGHDWVRYPGKDLDPEELKDALQYSPLGASVQAWNFIEGVYTKKKGTGDNHWITIYGYEDGKYWHVFDHYDDTHKKLVWDYDFLYVKRYTLERLPVVKQQGLWSAILEFIRAFRNFFNI